MTRFFVKNRKKRKISKKSFTNEPLCAILFQSKDPLIRYGIPARFIKCIIMPIFAHKCLFVPVGLSDRLFLCLIYRSFKKGAENHGGTDSHYG